MTIIIRDSGIGIKDEDKGKLFLDYSRVDPHRNRGVEGTGLVLTITRSLCHMMSGSISFDSVYGKGSSFKVTLPQEVEREGRVALVLDKDRKLVLFGVTREDYAGSHKETLENLKARYVLTKTPAEFSAALSSGAAFTHVLAEEALYKLHVEKIENFLPKARVAVITDVPKGRPGKSFTYMTGPVYSLVVANFLNNAPSMVRYDGRARRDRILVPKGRVLVVDDLETNLQVASALLS